MWLCDRSNKIFWLRWRSHLGHVVTYFSLKKQTGFDHIFWSDLSSVCRVFRASLHTFLAPLRKALHQCWWTWVPFWVLEKRGFKIWKTKTPMNEISEHCGLTPGSSPFARGFRVGGRVLLRLLLRRSDVISGGVFSGYKDHVSPLPPSLFLRSCRRDLGHFAKMGFGDLKSASGLKVLNDFLSDRSYIEGWVRLFSRCGPVRSWVQLPAAPPSWRAVSWYHGAFWITVRRNELREAAEIDEEVETANVLLTQVLEFGTRQVRCVLPYLVPLAPASWWCCASAPRCWISCKCEQLCS